MLQVSVLKANPEEVKKRLAVKHFKQPELVDTIIGLDDERKKLQLDFDNTQAKINAASKEIGKLMAQGNKDAAEALKAEVAGLKTNLEPIKSQMATIEQTLLDTLLQLPNLPTAEVPEGRSPEENIVVREGGEKPALFEGAQPHWDLTKKYNLIDFELGNKITGSGFPVYIGKGAKLQRALIQYFLDYNTAAGYTEYLPPFMVNAASAMGTGQLPDKEGQMYHSTIDNLYLIPTAEVPITNIYRDVILKAEQLPIKNCGYTPCFRREAGSYGAHVRGLNRLHQFDKVEIVQIAHPDKSYEVLEEMREYVAGLLRELELPFRILKLCGGDMSFASALTYDFETYSTAQQKWLEVSSVSNFETFQSNRLKLRFKDGDAKPVLAHTLNGSALALPRIVATMLENNQTPEGIKIPKALIPYCGFDVIK